MATDPARARALRRRHQHERQAVVFGGLVAALAVAGLGAAAVYTDAIDAPFLEREFATPAETTATGATRPDPPCPPAEMLPLDNAAVQVNVYNGSDRAGLAGITADQLRGRGFTVVSTDNYPNIDVPVQLLFGVDGIDAAYTLAAQFADPTLVLDTREDVSVDLVLGEDFAGLVEANTVELDPSTSLEGVAGCVPVEEIDPVPGPTPTATEELADDAPAEDEAPADETTQG